MSFSIHAKPNRFSVINWFIFSCLIVAILSPAVIGGSPVELGSADNFIILAKSGITSTGSTKITGDIGVNPIDSMSLTGFQQKKDVSNQFSTSSLVQGKIYAPDYAAPTPTLLTKAVSNMETAYTDAAGRVNPVATELYGGNLGGKTLSPGVYKWSTVVQLPPSTILTLNGEGDETATWIFQIAGDLTLSPSSQVILINNARPRNVFWQIAGPTGVTIGPGAHIEGSILAQKAITMKSGASLRGKALAQTAVTLISNQIS